MNADLAKAVKYSKLDQKSVKAWLDLRNKAAHGKYSEYTIEQVILMLAGVRDFISRIDRKDSHNAGATQSDSIDREIPKTTLSGQADRPISNTNNQLLTTQVEVGFLGSLGPKGSTARLFNPLELDFSGSE